jgi:outer membrane protein
MARYSSVRLIAGSSGLAALLMPAGVLAQMPAPDVAAQGISASDMFKLADAAVAARRLDDAEAFLRALTQDAEPDIRIEARFRLALLLDGQGRQTEAAVLLRQILDEKPEAGRVRIELARILAAMGEEGKAGAQLRAAQAGGLPEDVAQVVDRMAAALRSTRPLGGSFELTFAPDSNINRGTAARTLDTVFAPLTLSTDARERSGLGVRLAGQGYARLGMAPGITLVPRLSGDAALYRESAANDVTGSLGIGLEWQGKKDRMTPSIAASWRNYGGHALAQTVSASIDWRRPVGRRALGTASLSIAKVNFQQNDLQDGRIYSLSLGLERALSARSGIGLTVAGARQTARDKGYASSNGGLTVIGWHDIGRTTLFANAGIRRLVADARLFPFTDRRREWFAQASAGAVFRQITVAGFSPLVRASFERNRSTVSLYDYKRLTGHIGITRAF